MKEIEETVHDIERPEKEENNKSMLEAESTHQLAASLDGLEQILGYKFKDKKLLEEAFTHHSYPNKSFSYERLEYVGDSVLNLIFTKEHFFMYPNLAPGPLTRLRAANVDTEKLARVAIKHGLHQFLRHNMPLLQEQIREFSQAIADYPLHSNGQIEVPKVLADIVESTVGATFIDDNCSTDTVWKVFKNLLEPVIRLETLKMHPVTELYEVCNKRHMKVRFVDMWKECMSFNVFVDGKLAGKGTSASKKEIAHNRAAKDALDNIHATILQLKNQEVDTTENS
ncbi:hypothetical protein K2173_018766 [Erythroxylum novogranatense]|uniref:RNase III domain-containing protein n=1 Tax=Erythroxylum novogranatense TaxID=1862640 RepID=A0AAV8SB68_9ROSI|nr:hypothetical protein K2173_018766 [Erythroxylum novogranatense]